MPTFHHILESLDHRYPRFSFHPQRTSIFAKPLDAFTASMEPNSLTGSKTVHEVKIDMPTDPEPQGYDRLSAFMGYFPEAAIFRRFATLNAKNILYLQAELLWLEEQLEKVADDDAQSSSERRRHFSREWFRLSHSGDHPDGSSRQWTVFMKIRRALSEYSMYNLSN